MQEVASVIQLPPTDSITDSPASLVSTSVEVDRNAIRDAVLTAFQKRSTAVRAAIKYLRRRDRLEYPRGKSDGGGRWFPDISEKLDVRYYRSPSRRFPWSYMQACRTIGHCAMLERCKDPLLVRRIASAIESEIDASAAINAVRTLLIRKTGKRNRTSHACSR
jgi:hypothetical protein